AIGNNPIASGYASLAMGDYTTASGRISTAMGNRTTAPSGYETVFGRYNSDYTPSSTTEWIATDRLFVVGNGATDVAKSNALTILKNANTTIGGSLTLNGNGTNTSITLPTTRGTNGQVLQTDGGGNTSWSSFTGSQWTTSGSNIYYNSGNVGIGTITPNSKLTFDNSHDSGFDEWSDYKILLYTDATPQQSYGIGIKANTLAFNTDHDYDFDQDGSTVMTIQEGKVGIGTASPLALFDLGNSISNRKIILYSFADNDHQFTGLGLNVDALRFQLATTSGNFKFYGATSSTASTELFRIQGNGQIIIPALSTAGVLLNSNTGLVSSSVGTSGQVLTTNGSGGITWTTPSSGTVSSVSGTAPISVATGTTTPVISIAAATTLAAGSMSAADKTKLNAISGTNTGDQTITLTGDVTGSGMESFAATISSASVTNSKLANMASNTMKVNNTAASASPSDLSITANTFPARSSTGNIAAKPVTDFALTILDDANAAAVRTTIGAGTGNGTVTTVTGTAPINVATGATTPVISIAAATTSAAGSMSAADKTKLDGLVGSQWTTSGSNIYYNTGNVGIGTATANAQLQLGNTTANRKIILWQNTNDDHQFYGLGVNSNVFRLQIPNTSANFKFYGATSSSASTELFRIQGDGQIMIPALTTAGVLLNTSTGMITSSIGTNGQVLTTSSGGNLTWTTPNSGTVSAISTINGITGGPITTSGSIGLTGQALALHDLGTIGFITRTGSGTVATRAIKSGTGITVANGDGVVGDPTIALDTYSIGDFAQGGIVFWVDETGHHGLVCAKQDQSDDAKWWAGTYTNTMARGDGPFSGEMNTAIIIANQSYGNGTNYAARICNELKITEGGKTYGDWYLPSIEEAFLMYQNRTIINVTATANGGSNFANWMYWTSTENSNSTAWLQGFLTTSTQDAHDKQYGFNVRAIRAF
ncbi:MAG: hypothetical protein JXA03_05015, partial [Bacteroidales bacterium]|nr:hypothetical protein [Bacteroidales bacterium]